VTLEVRDLTTGMVVTSYPLPTSATATNQPFTLSGSATSDGVLNQGTNGDLALAGYASAPGIAQVVSSTTVPRVVARIRPDAGIDTSTLVSDAYPGNNLRSAATVDGAAYWLGGTASADAGVRTTTHGSTGATTAVFTDIQNIRATHIFAGQLYASTAAGTQPDGGLTYSRIFAVGTGIPTTTATVTYLPGVNISLASSFVLLDRSATVAGLDVLYAADTGAGTGVRKYTFNGTVWAEEARLNGNFPATAGCLHVTARAINNTVVVLCSADNGVVYRFDDVAGTPMATILATAPAGTAFRGITLGQ